MNKRALLWQVPNGNRVYLSENNTDGHYQDNRAEYLFAHIQELAATGVIGLLFGSGNGGSTVQWDGKRDGVTNPSSFCSADGMSSGQVCNTHPSTYPDDDGGYLRITAATYYQDPYPLS